MLKGIICIGQTTRDFKLDISEQTEVNIREWVLWFLICIQFYYHLIDSEGFLELPNNL